MSAPIDGYDQKCPAEGCTNDRDPVLGLCRRCRGVVERFRIDEIADAHREIKAAADTVSKSRAELAWKEAINKATSRADAWRRNNAPR